MYLQFYLFLLLCIVNPVIPSTFKETFLAIGNTGLGKSFTAKLFELPAKEGHGVNSETAIVTVHENEKYKFIDTPGFDDSDVAVEDENTKLNILFEMQKANVTFVHTIFWFVKTDVRTTQSLTKQAKFINDLAMNGKESNVWSNAIIISKGNSEELHEEPIKKAIEKAINNAKLLVNPHILPVFLYEKLKPDSNFRDISDDKLRKFGIYKDKDEIKNKYKEIMRKNRHTDHPVQIVFNNETCVKCGIKIDKRLSGRFPCHTNEVLEHDDIEEYNYNTIYTHPGRLEIVQDPGWEKAGRIVGKIPIVNILGGLVVGIGQEVKRREEWSCCQRSRGSTGCKVEHSTKLRYTCCHKDVITKPPGCKKVCKSCRKAWGNSEGCTKHTQHVFV